MNSDFERLDKLLDLALTACKADDDDTALMALETAVAVAEGMPKRQAQPLEPGLCNVAADAPPPSTAST